MAFSASEAAFEGFRIVRREPGSVLAWAGLQLIFSVAIALLTVAMMRPLFAAGALAPAAQASPQLALARMTNLFPLYALMVPFYLVVYAVLGAAIYRAVLRPEDKAVARLRFGADELRLVGVWVLLALLWIGASILVGIAVVLLAAGAGLAMRSSPAIGALAVLVLYLGFIAFFAWFSVKFSLAGPMTFASRKIQLFTSWRLTKGRFWSLFGCYLLAIVFIVLMSLVVMIFEAVLLIGSSGGSFTTAAAAMFTPNVSSLQAYFTPARLLMLPIGAAVGAVFLTVGIAPSARAYKDIAGVSPEAQAETFA